MGRTLLERWLSQRVGYCVRLDTRDVGRVLYDGKVFYDLLASYGVVNIEMFGGIPGRGKKSEEEAYRCLAQLCDAFRFLNVDADEEYLRGIAKRNGPYAVRLLYQLYMKLEDKQFLDLLAPKRDDTYDRGTKDLVVALHKKFRRRDLEDGVTAEKELNMVKHYDDARKRIIKHCAGDVARRREDLNRLRDPYVPIDFKAGGEPSYLSTLLSEEEEETFDLDPREYVESLKTRERQRKNYEYQTIKMTPQPVIDVWTDILERMDDVFKSTFKKRMDQQSDYEKFHALKWSGAHHKFKRFFETKMDRYVDSDEEDHSGHVVKNEILRKGGEAIGKKQEPIWKLHHKLWAKKKRQRKRCNYEMCRHIVQDLVDVLMKVLLYRYENKRAPVPRKLMNDWKEGFFKCELTPPPPRITVVESSIGEEEAHPEDDLLMDLLKDREFDSEIFIDREVIKLLNEFNMHCYIYLVGPWDPLKWPDWDPQDENLMVNGFIVHRLLETKYPLPKGYQDPEFDFKYKVALSTIKDPNTAYIYNTMRNLMTKQDMIVLDIIEPMNYCLNVYHAETAAIEDQESEAVGGGGAAVERRQSKRRQSKRQSRGGSQASQRRQSKRKSSVKNRDSKDPSSKPARKSMGAKQRKSMGAKQRKSTSAKSGGGGGRKSNAGGRKSMGGGKRKSMAGGGKKIADPNARTRAHSVSKRGRDKAVQCPSIDSLVPRVNHSPAGLLGKEAFAFLNEARPVSDLLSGKMLIEYLKMKKDSIKGVALLSYPLTVSQAVLLEFLMTGRPLKTDYKISPEIEKFIQDELRPQPYLDTRILVEFENVFSPDLHVLSKYILEMMADPLTAHILNSEHKKLLNKPDDLEAVNATLTTVANALPRQQSAKTLITDAVPVSSNIQTQAMETQIDKELEIEHTEAEYPGWELKSYNERTPSRRELADKIRTEVYNVGRFRPQLSREAYEKLKAHVFALLAWIRSERKYREKPVPEVEVLGEIEEEIVEDEEYRTEVVSNPQVEPKKEGEIARPMDVTIVNNASNAKPLNVVLRPEEYMRPISYVDLLKLRSSEIMPRPNKDQMEIHYNTSSFFLKYMKCLPKSQAKKEEDDYQARKLKYDKFMEDEMPGEEFILDPIIESQPDSFYKVYGKKEVFDFVSIDYDSITRLCRMIIDEPWDDDDPKRRSSVLLFDADALKKLKADLPGSKKRMSKSGRRSSKRQSTGGKRKSTARRASKRKSSGGNRKSTANKRQSTASKRKSAAGKRQSAAGKRKSAAGKRQSAAGKRQSAAGKRQSAAGKRQSAAGKRQSTGGKNTRRSTTMKGGKNKESATSTPKEVEEKVAEEEEIEVEEQPPPPPPPSPPALPPPPPPTPGEEGWAYVEEIIPNIYQIYLATTWETVEFEYLSNLLHLFYLMRVHDNKVIPYRNFVRNEMESSLLHTDKRMETVTAFQKAFNDLKSKLRRHSDIKRSLHCRIYALYNDLVDIADVKRNAALARREELLNQRWTTKHLFTLANLFLNLIQMETDRTIGSLQLIHDYYFAMLQKPPSKVRLELLDIPKVYVPKREVSTLTVEETSTKKILLPWEKIEEKAAVPDYVIRAVDSLDYLLKSSVVKSIDPNPTHPLILRGVDLANTRANEIFDFYEELILDIELGKELRPKILKKLSPEEEKERRKQEKAFRKMLARRKQKIVLERSPSEGRYSQPRKIRKKKPDMDLDEEEEQLLCDATKPKFHIDASKLQMVDRLKWEWLVAVQNEINRLRFRLNLIQRRAEADLDEVLTILKAGFDEFFHDIGWQYRREIKAIEQVIETFKAATDLEVDTPVPLILDNDQFYFGKYPIAELYPDIPPPPNTPIITIPKEFVFTVQQLNNFIRKIEDVSPDGIVDRYFVDILEDMVTYNREMNYEFLPPGWSELSRNDIRFLVEQAFGSDYVVNWRDFLLFCTGLRYPTVEEIVEMRMRFREVDEYGFENIQYSSFMNIPIWFEKDLDTEEDFEWGQEMKKLLFKLFRTSRKEINYTELLLTLCKGKEPEEGFGKALSLMVGVGYIFWPDPPDWIHPRHVVDYILIQLLHDVIIKADYMTVTDFVPERIEEEEEIPELGEEEAWGEIDLPEILKMVDEHLEEEVEDEAEVVDKYKQILWRTCVPYEACLALLFVALRFWELPPSHMLRQLDVETGLKKLFYEQGVGSHMKAYKLAQSKLVKDIFHNTSAFKECNVPEMVYSIVLSKRHVIGAKNAFEGKY